MGLEEEHPARGHFQFRMGTGEKGAKLKPVPAFRLVELLVLK